MRLKRFLEMRGADGGPWARLCALPALWVGLLYDDTAMSAAFDLVKGWAKDDHGQLRLDVPRYALRTEFRGRPLLALAREAAAIAREGLKRRGRLSTSGEDEGHFLDPLMEILDKGRTPAEDMLDDFATRWGRSVDPAFTEHAY